MQMSRLFISCKTGSYVAFGAFAGAMGVGQLNAQNADKAAYYIAEIDIHNAGAYATYVPKVGPTLKPYGGKYIVATSKAEGIEGAPPAQRVVILQFPSLEKAKGWYNSKEYSDIKPQRLANATTRSFLVEESTPQP